MKTGTDYCDEPNFLKKKKIIIPVEKNLLPVVALVVYMVNAARFEVHGFSI
jgi:hypothetical protein